VYPPAGIDGPQIRRYDAMPELLSALDAFLRKHRRCGELDGGVDDERVWMACEVWS
jgi:hypothetical protein